MWDRKLRPVVIEDEMDDTIATRPELVSSRGEP